MRYAERVFRIACVACHAPFKIDERKMRADTIVMRCPRCGASFRVARPAAAPQGTPPERR